MMQQLQQQANYIPIYRDIFRLLILCIQFQYHRALIKTSLSVVVDSL